MGNTMEKNIRYGFSVEKKRTSDHHEDDNVLFFFIFFFIIIFIFIGFLLVSLGFSWFYPLFCASTSLTPQ